jgi:hypothetical protein
MKEENPKLTISAHNRTVTIEFNFTDPVLSDWLDAFKGALVAIGYGPELVDSIQDIYTIDLQEYLNKQK